MLACIAGCLSIVLGLETHDSGSALVRSAGASPPTVIAVTEGKPTERAFRLSRSLLPWPKRGRSDALTFRVTNRGALPHDFEVCTAPVRTANANTCRGKTTTRLGPGQSATLTVGFKARGFYEYLSTLPGDAAGGMRGLIGVGVTPPETPVTEQAPTPSSLVGDPNAGKSVFVSSGCGTCHTLSAAGADGDVGASLDVVKPTQAVILQYVTNGSPPMPAYTGTLTPTQIDDVAAYVYLTTHTIN